MKKIIILNTFDYWERDHLWIGQSAYQDLKKKGFIVDQLHIPFKNEPIHFFTQVLAYRTLDLSYADKVITLGPFAHVIEHPRKICLLTQHMKGFYELWKSPYGELDSESNVLIKEKIHYLDLMCLSEAKNVFCFYDKIEKRFQGIDIKTIPLPEITGESSKNKDSVVKKIVLALGTFGPDYRFDALIRSITHCQTADFKVIIAAKIKRKDIFESLLRIGQDSIQKGRLEIIANPTDAEEKELVLASQLLFEVATELDILPKTTFQAITHGKDIVGFTDSGLLSSIAQKQGSTQWFSNGHEAISQFIDNYFSVLQTSRKPNYIYSDYLKSTKLDWERVL